jgi:hypothetical protein
MMIATRPAKRKAVRRVILERMVNDVTHASDGSDQRRIARAIYFQSETTDVGLNDRRPRIQLKPPDLIEYHGPRHNAAAILEQDFEHLEFARLQMDDVSAASNLTRDKVDLKIVDLE